MQNLEWYRERNFNAFSAMVERNKGRQGAHIDAPRHNHGTSPRTELLHFELLYTFQSDGIGRRSTFRRDVTSKLPIDSDTNTITSTTRYGRT